MSDVLTEIEEVTRSPAIQEQWRLTYGERTIILCNMVEGLVIEPEHIDVINDTLKAHNALFPNLPKKPTLFVATDLLPESGCGNPVTFPLHAEVYEDFGVVLFAPRTFTLEHYRRGQLAVSTLQAVIAHDLTHFMDDQLATAWLSAGYEWQYLTDELSVGAWVANKPDECVTDYARQYWYEDVCESVVAYMYDPEALMRVSPTKYALIEDFIRHQANPDEC